MTRKAETQRADIYARITEEIIAAIETGPGPWRAPWFHEGTGIARPTNVSGGKRYRGINTLALWAAGLARGYSTGLWGTYRQWQTRGAQVREGEKATTVVLWKEITPMPEGDEDAETNSARLMFARAFSVFNLAQVTGYEPPATRILTEVERITRAEAFIGNLSIPTISGASSAYYRPDVDTVYMPPFSAFRDATSYYAVWLHELGHASGAARRLNRDLSGRFGTAAYAAEECCVEIASGFVLADLGIAHHPRDDHAAYLASWLTVLRDDPRAIFVAASKAQQIADWMHDQQAEIV